MKFDFPDLYIGIAEYREGPTGCTVFYFPNNAISVADVRGAVIYDFFRNNMIYPDKELGRAALKSAQTGIFPLGFHGVGCWPGCGQAVDYLQPDGTGQGGAFRQIGPTKICVFTEVILTEKQEQDIIM